jgi:hypothetical protein
MQPHRFALIMVAAQHSPFRANTRATCIVPLSHSHCCAHVGMHCATLTVTLWCPSESHCCAHWCATLTVTLLCACNAHCSLWHNHTSYKWIGRYISPLHIHIKQILSSMHLPIYPYTLSLYIDQYAHTTININSRAGTIIHVYIIVNAI